MADNSQTTNQDIPSSNATATLGHLGRPIPEARAYLNKAQRFVSFAKYLHGQLLAARRRFSDYHFERPTPEDMRDISATKTQSDWSTSQLNLLASKSLDQVNKASKSWVWYKQASRAWIT